MSYVPGVAGVNVAAYENMPDTLRRSTSVPPCAGSSAAWAAQPVGPGWAKIAIVLDSPTCPETVIVTGTVACGFGDAVTWMVWVCDVVCVVDVDCV